MQTIPHSTPTTHPHTHKEMTMYLLLSTTTGEALSDPVPTITGLALMVRDLRWSEHPMDREWAQETSMKA